jgi:hypothetical protein
LIPFESEHKIWWVGYGGNATPECRAEAREANCSKGVIIIGLDYRYLELARLVVVVVMLLALEIEGVDCKVEGK